MSPHTVRAYRQDLEQLRDFLVVKLKRSDNPCEITLVDMRMWVASMVSDGLKTCSVVRKIQSARRFFHYLQRYHGLPCNPAAELQAPAVEKRLPDCIREEEINATVDSFEFDETSFVYVRDSLIVSMLYTTGMRSAELIGLKNSAVDTVRGELKVLGKRNKERIIPFGDELKEMITRYRTLRTSLLDTLGQADASDDAFFIRPTGESLYYGLLYRTVRRELDGAGVHASRRSPHILRHSFATDMLNNGADLSALQQLLGHASLASTQKYTHLTYRDLKTNYELAHPRAQKKED